MPRTTVIYCIPYIFSLSHSLSSDVREDNSRTLYVPCIEPIKPRKSLRALSLASSISRPIPCTPYKNKRPNATGSIIFAITVTKLTPFSHTDVRTCVCISIKLRDSLADLGSLRTRQNLSALKRCSFSPVAGFTTSIS